ncbi:hypothetical protein [Pontibacter ruber]|uniref:Uncharacterized protein n=1 Tax=Pontibacter ruber TaxID=1343895 RepID=A0ABW5D2I9_9BACT|nr:hypothetical protein [Pontibacter ruber]
MLILRVILLVLVSGWLCSCRSESSQQEEVQQRKSSAEPPAEILQDTSEFKAAFKEFFAALQASDTSRLDQFIHPKYGLWIIEQPGALPRMTHVTDISSFRREYQDRSFFTVKDEVTACDLKEEVWPTFDCADVDYEAGKSGYSKDGCFLWQPGKFQKSGYWDYASLSATEIQRIKATLPLLKRSVLHTATSFEFHFGYIDGQWRLLFTKLIYPCSA